MGPFYLLLAIALILIINLLGLLMSTVGGSGRSVRYERRWPFLTPAERRCLAALEEAVGADYRVLPRVALSAVISIAAGGHNPAIRRAQERLQKQTIDFVLCARIDDHPLCVIQHLPAGKRKRAQRRRLDWLQKVCALTQLPLVTLTEQAHYDPLLLREQFADILTAKSWIASDPLYPNADEEEILLRLSAALRDPDDLRKNW